ncbi:MAG: PASTA domain-containing protein [Bryobacterales bacterium]|nr:PASTA domain-containing protein [Bryobacterales bacterium]
MIGKHALTLILAACIGASAPARAGIIDIGILSFDEFIPAGGSPGINAINLANVTGSYSLAPDFPAVSSLTFLNSTLTLTPESSAPVILNLGDIGPGFLLDSFFNPLVQAPSDVAYTSVIFNATIAATPLELFDGRFVSPTGTTISASLLPATGSRLLTGDLTIIRMEFQDAPTAVPEPSFWGVLALMLSGAFWASRRRRMKGAATMQGLLIALMAIGATQLPAVAQSTPVQVSLPATPSPSAGQPGVTTHDLMGTGFPAGAILPSRVTITLTPVSTGPAMTATVNTITAVSGSARRVNFRFAGTAVNSPTAYNVALAGTTETGTAFAGRTTARLTINPPAAITLTPTAVTAGATAKVTINGQYTNFLNGATAANFGPDIAVNGAAAGTLARVTVTSATAATAQVTVAQGAAAGPRTITVATGVQQATANLIVNAPSPTNQPPTANAGPDQTKLLNSIATLDGTLSRDPENQPISYNWTLTNRPDGSSAAISNPAAAQPTLPLDRAGQYRARLVVSDGQLSSVPDEVMITVPANGPPVLSAIPNLTVAIGTTFRLQVVATDPDPQDTLTYSLLSGPAGAQMNPAPRVQWTPAATQIGGPYGFNVRVQDNNGNADSKTFNVTVLNTNGAPLFDALPDETTGTGVAFTRQLSAQDPNPGDVLTYALVSGPGGMTIAGRQLSWTPTSAQTGDFPVRVRVTDPGGLTGYGQFLVTVKPVLAPVATDDRYEVSLGQPLTAPAPGVLLNDLNPNPSPMTANRLTDPDKGSASLGSDGALNYTPPFAPAGPAITLAKRAGNYSSASNHPNGRVTVADFTGDGKPELIHHDGQEALWITRGDTGTGLISIFRNFPITGGLECAIRAWQGVQIAAADIDDDGKVEILLGVKCTVDAPPGYPFSWYNLPSDRVAAIVYDPAAAGLYRVKWISNRLSFGNLGDELSFPSYGATEKANFTIARLRSNETPSILFGSTYSNWAAKPCSIIGAQYTNPVCRAVHVLDGATGTLRQIYHSNPPFVNNVNSYAQWGQASFAAPVVADIDNDGALDILYQGTLWNLNGTVKRQFDGVDIPGGRWTQYSFPLDIDGDAEMEIITQSHARDATTSQLYLKAFNPDGTLLWQMVHEGNQDFTSQASAADVDRDGVPEIIFGTWNELYVLEARTGKVRWVRNIPQSGTDTFAKVPGQTMPVYDLNGDGIVDMVLQYHMNNIWILRADNGETQTTYTVPGANQLASIHCCVPVIADLGGNGQANVAWTREMWTGVGEFVNIMAGAAGTPWRSAPRQFNQYAYWGSNFNADGSVPRTYVRHTADPRTNVFHQQPPDPYAPGFIGSEQTSFTYSARSQGLTSNPATVRIALSNNRKPVFTSVPPKAMIIGTSITYAARAVDPDPADTVTYRIAGGAGSGYHTASINATTGNMVISGQPVGVAIVIAATDNRGAVAFQTVAIQGVSANTTVPGVTGLSQAAATTAITAANLTLGEVEQVYHSSAIGNVISQAPAAGATVAQTEGVNLVVSKGLAPVLVPNLVGQPRTSAQTALSALGFSATVTNVFSSTVPEGEVIQQAPAGGTLLAPPAAIALTVSAGNGLLLQLSRTLTTADTPIPFSVLATDVNGVAIAAPAMTYSIAGLNGATAGGLPVVSGNSIIPANTTRGAFRITGTDGATGRSVAADFVVSYPVAAGTPSMMSDFAQLTAAMADIDALIKQGKAARQSGNTALVNSVLTQMVNRWRQVNLKSLSIDTPFALEEDFFPTPDQLASFGLTPTADDLLMRQIRLDAAADLQEWTDALLAQGTPMSELQRLADKFATRAARSNGLALSEWGAIQDQAVMTVLVTRRLPALYDALMSEVARSLGMSATVRALPLSKSGGERQSTLAELGTVLVMDYIIDKIEEKLTPKYKAAKKYTTDILVQAAYGSAVVRAVNHLRRYVQAEDITAVVAGASLSFRLFKAPFSMIEANVEKEWPELNYVLLIGPDAFLPLEPLIKKVQEAFSYRKTLDPADPNRGKKLDEFKGSLEKLRDAADTLVSQAAKTFQPTKLADKRCVFSTDPKCGELRYPDGFNPVYTYSPPQGFPGFTGLPLPIVFFVYNNVTGDLSIETPAFFPAPAPAPAPSN